MTDTCDGSVLLANAQCTVTLVFAPTTDSPVTKQAGLDLFAGPGGSFTVELDGDAIAP